MECKLQSQEVNCTVHLLIFEICQSTSCYRKIPDMKVKPETVSPSGKISGFICLTIGMLAYTCPKPVTKPF